MGPRCRKMEDQRPWPGFSRNQDFAEVRGLAPKVKMSELEDALSKVVQLKRITDGGLGAKLPATGGYGCLGAILPVAGRFFEKLKVLTFKTNCSIFLLLTI